MEDKTNVIIMIPTDHHQNTTSSNSCCVITNTAALLDSTDNVMSNEKPKKTVLARCIKRVNRVFSPFKRKRKSPSSDRKPLYADSSDIHQPLDSRTMLEGHKEYLKDEHHDNRDLFNYTYFDANEVEIQGENCTKDIIADTISKEKKEEELPTEYHYPSEQHQNRVHNIKSAGQCNHKDLHNVNIIPKNSIRFKLVGGSIKRKLQVSGKRDVKGSATTTRSGKGISIEEDEVLSSFQTPNNIYKLQAIKRKDILEGEPQIRLGS